MSVQYVLRFGSSSPANYTGLSPTITSFRELPAGTVVTPPGVTEIPSSSGLYYFTYGATAPISFIVDGGAALSSTERYIAGVVDPLDNVQSALIGDTSSSYGSTSVDPTTLFGYLKRLQELGEGDAQFNKSSGAWTIYNRGASTLLRVKALANNSTTVTKS